MGDAAGAFGVRAKGAGQEPDGSTLVHATELTCLVGQRILIGWYAENPLPPGVGPFAVGMAVRIGIGSNDAGIGIAPGSRQAICQPRREKEQGGG